VQTGVAAHAVVKHLCKQLSRVSPPELSNIRVQPDLTFGRWLNDPPLARAGFCPQST
jgi:hypothetical protein